MLEVRKSTWGFGAFLLEPAKCGELVIGASLKFQGHGLSELSRCDSPSTSGRLMRTPLVTVESQERVLSTDEALLVANVRT